MKLPLSALTPLLLATTAALSAEIPPLYHFSIENMDKSTDPGTDFYQVCKWWLAEEE